MYLEDVERFLGTLVLFRFQSPLGGNPFFVIIIQEDDLECIKEFFFGLLLEGRLIQEIEKHFYFS